MFTHNMDACRDKGGGMGGDLRPGRTKLEAGSAAGDGMLRVGAIVFLLSGCLTLPDGNEVRDEPDLEFLPDQWYRFVW